MENSFEKKREHVDEDHQRILNTLRKNVISILFFAFWRGKPYVEQMFTKRKANVAYAIEKLIYH